MPGYRCYFFGADNRILKRVEYEADTDEIAIIEGRARYAEGEFGNGFEVWERSRLLYSKGKERCASAH